MELITQPEDGVTPLIKAIDSATKSIQIAIFRFDRTDIQHALERAAARGVTVHALIAYTNRGGDDELRKLEMEFLRAGIEVSRTAEDLLRYHYKFMVVDHNTLYTFTFNYTYLDIGITRSFGIITRNADLVHEAIRLFESDVKRQAFTSEADNFIVSPVNARHELARFIRGAERELLIYDPDVSDPEMIHLLRERARAGVKIQIIGRVSKGSSSLGPHGLMRMRFHTRTIIRDRRRAFVGSQSLCSTELDRRRELGLIVRDHDVLQGILKAFEFDWLTLTPAEDDVRKDKEPILRAAKKAKAIIRELPLSPLVERALKRALTEFPHEKLGGKKFGHRVEDAVRAAMEGAVSKIIRESVRQESGRHEIARP